MGEIERGGLRLAYERRGEGPPVVFVSPLGWSGAHWRLHQVGALSGEFEVVTYDHRGTGSSSVADGPYSTRLLARDLLVLFEELDLLEPLRVVGLGSGGAVVQWLCLDQPAAVRAAVFVASGPGQFDERPLARDLPADGLAAVEEEWPAALTRRLASREYFLDPAAPVVAPFVAAVTDGAAAAVAWRWHAEAARGHQLTEHIAEIEVPALVVVGEEDEVAPPGEPNPIESSLELAKRLFYAEYVEIPGAAHALHVEQAEAFNASIRDFLTRY
ncbi:MAG TPA: alpha/beta hydrolase [Acidimicrobiales bacterium]|nr:alpha/beta hydrolase [Acidimicrobiales bacterium]